MHSRLAVIAALSACAGLSPSGARAADMVPDMRIEAVTVYRSGALVTRRGMLNAPAGEHRLVIRGLPADLDIDTFRLAVDQESIQLGAVEFQTITQAGLASEAERQLAERRDMIAGQIRVVEDDVATAQLELKIMDGLAGPAATQGTPAVTGATIQATLQAVRPGSAAARQRIRDAGRMLLKLKGELNAATAELGKYATQRKATIEVRAIFRATAPVAGAAVSAVYNSPDASWSPSYAGRLDTSASKLSLVQQAAVRQTSGEDWRDVALTLTSASPQGDLRAPKLPALYVDLSTPEPQERLEMMTEARQAAPAYAPAPGLGMAAIATTELSVTANRRVETAGTDFVIDYKLPGRATIIADSQPRLFPIDEQVWPVALVARVAPLVDRAVVLVAHFTNTTDIPLRRGDLQLFRDGALVGSTRIETVAPGAQATLATGVDERIRVKRIEEPGNSKLGARGDTVKAQRVRFDVTSYHSEPVVLELLDRIPVARNKEIEVEVFKDATPPSERNVGGHEGLWLWRLTLLPQKTVSVRHGYALRYPAKFTLEEDEVEDEAQ